MCARNQNESLIFKPNLFHALPPKSPFLESWILQQVFSILPFDT